MTLSVGGRSEFGGAFTPKRQPVFSYSSACNERLELPWHLKVLSNGGGGSGSILTDTNAQFKHHLTDRPTFRNVLQVSIATASSTFQGIKSPPSFSKFSGPAGTRIQNSLQSYTVCGLDYTLKPDTAPLCSTRLSDL